jgi:hypothetical protein
MYQPHKAQVDRLLEQNCIRYWANWQAMALHDNTVFLAFADGGEEDDGPPEATDRARSFVLRTLAHNVETDYLHLFLLVQFQRTWLSIAFEELVREGADISGHWRDVKVVWNKFVQFENCYCYTEVSDKPQANALYHSFQQALDVGHLYSEVKDQSTTLHDHYDGVVSRRTNALLTALAILGPPIGIATTIYGSKLVDNFAASWIGYVCWLIGLGTVFGILGGLWRRWGPS